MASRVFFNPEEFKSEFLLIGYLLSQKKSYDKKMTLKMILFSLSRSDYRLANVWKS